jgi:hypothetical protein
MITEREQLRSPQCLKVNRPGGMFCTQRLLLAGVARIQTGAGYGPARRHSGDAGVARGTEDRRSGDTAEAAVRR